VLSIESGKLLDSTITIDESEAIEIIWVECKLETCEKATTTGEFHDDGTATVAGTETKTETGTEVTTEFGNEMIADDGTELGTFE